MTRRYCFAIKSTTEGNYANLVTVIHKSQTATRNVRKMYQGIGFIESTPFGFESFEADFNDPLGLLTCHIFVMPQRLQTLAQITKATCSMPVLSKSTNWCYVIQA